MEPGSNCSEGITCVFVRKVVELVFEKNLMRANAVDFKTGSEGVVVVVQSKVVPVRMVMYDAEGASSGAGASLTAAGAV